jgi:hypothetical protein
MRSMVPVVVLGSLIGGAEARAGGFTPWGIATGDRTVALTPYLFVGPSGTTTLSPYVWFGASDHFDLMLGYSLSVTPRPGSGVSAVSSGAVELMPRAIINDYAIFALHALYTPGAADAILGLEFHGVADGSLVAFTYNTGWWPKLGGEDGFASGDWFAILVPEFKLGERVSVFAEFNPSVATSDGTFGAKVVPGLTFYVDEQKNHSLTAAVTLAVAPTWQGATFGLLYFTDFDLSAKKKAVSSPAVGASRALGAPSFVGR